MTEIEEAFTVGPPEPVFDSRRLPAVTAEDEEAFVPAADLAEDHPDNDGEPTDDEIGMGPVDPAGDLEDEGEPPSADELDALIADVDDDDVDQVGFDDADLVEPFDLGGSDEPVGGGS